MRLRFGEFVFDSRTRELRHGGRPLPLPPKPLRFLEVLLEGRPEALSKSQIMERVWPDTFVTEASLARLAAELRAAIGDDAKAPRFVRTVYGLGYAFCGEARDEPLAASDPPPRALGLRLTLGSREIPLTEGENILGRAEDARVWIDSVKASRRHARVMVRDAQATLEDLASKNGTFLRGRRIAGPEPLRDGDEIVIGPILMTFRAGPSRSTETDTAVRRPV
jgi:DNA-binding winged helix-turn-helix (wHTH) protein